MKNWLKHNTCKKNDENKDEINSSNNEIIEDEEADSDEDSDDQQIDLSEPDEMLKDDSIKRNSPFTKIYIDVEHEVSSKIDEEKDDSVKKTEHYWPEFITLLQARWMQYAFIKQKNKISKKQFLTYNYYLTWTN